MKFASQRKKEGSLEQFVYVETYLELVFSLRFSLGGLDKGVFTEGEEFLECKHPPKLLLELEKTFEIVWACKEFSQD